MTEAMAGMMGAQAKEYLQLPKFGSSQDGSFTKAFRGTILASWICAKEGPLVMLRGTYMCVAYKHLSSCTISLALVSLISDFLPPQTRKKRKILLEATQFVVLC